MVDLTTEVYHNCISIDSSDSLISDCKIIFNCREVDDDNYSEGQTYFIKADTKPRCDIERCALSVFKYHTRNASYDAAISGAEFWTQVIDYRDDIGWHFDRDYGLEEDEDINVHPNLATVTYLTDLGGPTIILNKSSGINDKNISGHIDDAAISLPLKGKHLKFDGRLLHSAISDLKDQNDDDEDDDNEDDDDDEDDEGKQVRITFLVNIWLDHIPLQSSSLTDEQIILLHNDGDTDKTKCSINITDANKSNKSESIVINKENCTRNMSWTFLHHDLDTKVNMPMIPFEDIENIFTKVDLIKVKYSNDLKANVEIIEDIEGDDDDDDDDDDNDDDDDDDNNDEGIKNTENKSKKRKLNF